MKPLSDISSVMQTLRKGVENGHWTIEQLDSPSHGFRTCTAVDRRTFRSGYEGVQFRNLLRDTAQPHPEAVQVISDRDLPPMPQGITPAESQALPLTLEDDCPF